MVFTPFGFCANKLPGCLIRHTPGLKMRSSRSSDSNGFLCVTMNFAISCQWRARLPAIFESKPFAAVAAYSGQIRRTFVKKIDIRGERVRCPQRARRTVFGMHFRSSHFLAIDADMRGSAMLLKALKPANVFDAFFVHIFARCQPIQSM